MIKALLPHTAAAVEVLGEAPDAALLDDEVSAVRHAVGRRRVEFATGRHCARQALQALGRLPQAIPRGARGEPRWPSGVVGSITHCAGYCGCAVGDVRELKTVGIDAEPAQALPDGVRSAIARSREVGMLHDLAAERADVPWDRLLFSAKESVYKAWFPLASRWLSFEDAELTIDPAEGTFAARLLVPSPLATLRGRWLARDGLILTAVAVEAT